MIKIKSDENICCKDVLRSIFEINDLDLHVYKTLKKIGEMRADEVANIVKKERSTTYRSLQKLAKMGFCIKKTNKIKSGGYYHTYKCIEPKKIKKEIESCLDQWYFSMKNALERFDVEMY